VLSVTMNYEARGRERERERESGVKRNCYDINSGGLSRMDVRVVMMAENFHYNLLN
jgi:hypothetical protein